MKFECQQCGKVFKAKPSANRKYCSIQCAGKGIVENKKDKIVSICEVCGNKIYHVRSRKRKYCSRKCKHESLRNGVYKTCIICGKKFYVWKRYNEKYDARFCSNKCKASQKVEKTCPQCGKTFLVKPSQTGLVHCSQECRSKTIRKQCIRICESCGKTFEVNYPSHEGKFCSHECSSRSRIKKEIHVVSTCVTCGKQFEHTIYDVGRYCSKKCYLNNCGVSGTELLLKKPLIVLGFEPQLKYALGHMDYGNAAKKVVVFVDGRFWHGKSDMKWEHTSMAPSIKRAIERDKEQNIYLNNNGWKVLRYWDDYVNSNTDECVDEITKCINSR